MLYHRLLALQSLQGYLCLECRGMIPPGTLAHIDPPYRVTIEQFYHLCTCPVPPDRLSFEWSDIKQDLKALQEITLDDMGKKLAIRSVNASVPAEKSFRPSVWHPTPDDTGSVVTVSTFQRANTTCGAKNFSGTPMSMK
jgi:hypothetical protein